MPQIKISLEQTNIDFISEYSNFGYSSKSAIVDAAVSNFKQSLRNQKIIESAQLYQQVYENDEDLQELTDDAAGICLD